MVEADQDAVAVLEPQRRIEPPDPRQVTVIGKQHRRTIRRHGVILHCFTQLPGLQIKEQQLTQAIVQFFITEEAQQHLSMMVVGQEAEPLIASIQNEIVFATLISQQLIGQFHAITQQETPHRIRVILVRQLLNGDVIDGILSEEKREVDNVIISTDELNKYFGKEVTPAKMKEQIMALLDEWKEKQPPELAQPDKKKDLEK